MLSFQTITPNTLELLKKLAAMPELANMRLVGGTALALQYGHRQSIDLDFFSACTISIDQIESVCKKLGECTIFNRTEHIIQLTIDQIKVDFVDYTGYQWIDEPIVASGVTLASDKDIAAMKINAIINRGTKKDFIDLYVLLKHYSLSQILDFYHKKYPNFSDYRALMSLTYFEDAETQSMPKMFIPNTWEEMKDAIIENVKKYQA